MKVAVASDHRGYHLKEKVISLLKAKGHTVIDDGPSNDASVDYPDFAGAFFARHEGGEIRIVDGGVVRRAIIDDRMALGLVQRDHLLF